jgi:hypothetical protein
LTTKPGDDYEFWLYCAGNPEWNTWFNVTASFLYVQPESKDETKDDPYAETGLRKEGIAGIVVACVVAFLFIVGMLISFKGLAWIKNLFQWSKCCKGNKTMNLPDESPRPNPNDIERRETGLAGHPADIAHNPHSPVSIQPTHGGKEGGNSNGPLIDPDLMGATAAPFPGQDLNSTGQHLLSSLKNGRDSHGNLADYSTNQERNIQSAPNTGMPTSPSAQGQLPNIHVDKRPAAQQWNALDSAANADVMSA